MSYLSRDRDSHPSVVFGVTIGGSALKLLRGQLRWFSDRGWRVLLACTPDERARESAKIEGVELRGVAMRRGLSPLSDLRSFVRWTILLNKEKPYAINVGTPKAALLGGLAAWLTRVPKRIYVVWGLRLEGARGPMRMVLWAMERITTAVATDVVVISASLHHEMEKMKLINSNKCWLIGSGSSNGVDSRAIQKRISTVDISKERMRLNIPPDSFVVGYVGRITADKGIGTLLEAVSLLAQVHDIHFLIIGRRDGTFDTGVFAEFNRVHWVGHSDDVWAFYPLMDVLVLPTRREGFPNVVLEAASAAVPTITTKATGAIDSVVHEETGVVVDVEDHHALADAICGLFEDRDRLRKMGEAARIRAEVEFEPTRIWEGVEGIITGQPTSDTRRPTARS